MVRGDLDFKARYARYWWDGKIGVTMRSNDSEAMSHFLHLLRQLEATRFYGSVELKYEAGRVVLVRKSETFKPYETGCGNNRSAHHDDNKQP
jgi:hypothetical protein